MRISLPCNVTNGNHYSATLCVDGGMMLHTAGVVVEKCWRETPDHFPWARLDEFIVMPNHMHGIIIVEQHDAVGANDHSPLLRP